MPPLSCGGAERQGREPTGPGSSPGQLLTESFASEAELGEAESSKLLPARPRARVPCPSLGAPSRGLPRHTSPKSLREELGRTGGARRLVGCEAARALQPKLARHHHDAFAICCGAAAHRPAVRHAMCARRERADPLPTGMRLLCGRRRKRKLSLAGKTWSSPGMASLPNCMAATLG